VIRLSRLHGWSHAQRLVDAAEVVKHVVERQVRLEVLDLLAEPVGQPREGPQCLRMGFGIAMSCAVIS
jgi:hypothetical protein